MPIAALLARIERLVAHVAALGAENAVLKVRVGMLEAESAALKADNAALREKLGRPLKTPDNSGNCLSVTLRPRLLQSIDLL